MGEPGLDYNEFVLGVAQRLVDSLLSGRVDPEWERRSVDISTIEMDVCRAEFVRRRRPIDSTAESRYDVTWIMHDGAARIQTVRVGF